MPPERFVAAGTMRGFISSQSPLALPAGFQSLIQNGRLDDGIFRSRGGSQQVYTASVSGFPASGVIYGALTGTLDGVVWHFMALKVAGMIQVWAAKDSVGTWSEITAPNQAAFGNPYGTLRMTVPTNGPVHFQIVHDQSFNGGTPHDMLVVQSGLDAPRVWGPWGVLGSPAGSLPNPLTAITNQIPQPQLVVNSGSAPTPNRYLPWTTTAVATWSKKLNQNVTGTPVKTGIGITTFAGTNQINITSSIANGDTCKWTFGGTVDLSAASLVAMIIDSPDPNIWFKIQIQIGDGTNLVDLWNPQAGQATAFFDDIPSAAFQGNATQAMVVSQGIFPVPVWTTGVAAAVNPAAINTIKLIWIGPYVSGQATVSAEVMVGVNNGSSNGSSQFTSIPVEYGGYGYTTPPVVTIPAPTGGGVQAAALSILGDGVTIPKDAVASIQITVPGSQYDTGNTADSQITLGAPTTDLFFVPIVLAGSQGQLGGTDWAINFASSGSRSMGPRLIIANNQGDFLHNVKSTSASAAYESLQIQVRGDSYYSYQITYMMPGTTVYQLGVDRVLFYSKRPGDLNYYYSDVRNLASWDGSNWIANNASIGTYTPALTQDLSFVAPDEAIICVPTGIPMAAANGRFFVGTGNTVYYSEFNLPFQFRVLIRAFGGQFDSASGGSYSKSGEVIQAIVPIGAVSTQLNQLGTPVSTANIVYILTDRNLYLSSGFDALSLNKTLDIAKYGTYSPMSVGVGLTYWYFLASDGQVKRVEGYQVQDITVETIDNFTFNIPTARLPWVWGACANLRYFMPCSQGVGTTNAFTFVYSEIRRAWESKDTAPAAYTSEMLLADFPSSQTRLLAYSSLSSVPGVFTYDDQSQTLDAGSTGIPISITTREWASGFGISTFMGEVGIMADVYAGGSLTTTRVLTSGYGDATNAVGAISLSVPSTYPSAPRVNAKDTSGKGIEDLSVQLVISGTVVAQWKMYEGYVEIGIRQDRANRTS